MMNISKQNAESTINYINELAHDANKARGRSKSKSKPTAIRKPENENKLFSDRDVDILMRQFSNWECFQAPELEK